MRRLDNGRSTALESYASWYAFEMNNTILANIFIIAYKQWRRTDSTATGGRVPCLFSIWPIVSFEGNRLAYQTYLSAETQSLYYLQTD